jgi:hypothetical protein
MLVQKWYNKIHKLIILVPQHNNLECYCNERQASRHSIEYYNYKQAWILKTRYFKFSQATLSAIEPTAAVPWTLQFQIDF